MKLLFGITTLWIHSISLPIIFRITRSINLLWNFGNHWRCFESKCRRLRSCIVRSIWYWLDCKRRARTSHFRIWKGKSMEGYTSYCGTLCHQRMYFKGFKLWMDYINNRIICFGNSSSSYNACSILNGGTINKGNPFIQVAFTYLISQAQP